jgi:hypothetical protein
LVRLFFVVKIFMQKGTRNPPLTSIDPPSSAIEPPRSLGHHGLNLWNAVLNAYDIHDVGGRELLALACQTLDRVESLSEQIRVDGEVFRDGIGRLKAHPALRDELAGRAFIARTLERLGLNVETIKSPGRPDKHWRGSYD